jgi:ubiquinol-cytochrome c reductase cytochrome b subunit
MMLLVGRSIIFKGILGFFYGSCKIYPTPQNLNLLWCFGFMSGFFPIVQLITGLLLTMHYVADVSLAFDSIRLIMREVPFGWLLRYTHLNGASFFFLAIYLHMAKNIYYGSYLQPRYSIWVSGLILYLMLVGTAFSGYVSPRGQMSYWGATVISGLISTIPVIGHSLSEIIWGGETITTVTLRRFYTLHFLFPFLILGLMFLHSLFLHEIGSNNPEGFIPQDTIILHTYYSLKDLVIIFIFFFAFLYFIFFEPTMLGNPVNIMMADINFTPKKMVPEWYFLPMYTILRSINSRGGGVFSLCNFFLILFPLPSFSNPVVRSGDFKYVYQFVFFLIIGLFIVSGWAGSKSSDFPWIQISRFSTLSFFPCFLIILPILEFLTICIIDYDFLIYKNAYAVIYKTSDDDNDDDYDDYNEY